MCINPLCIIGFTYILFNFFKNRIEVEEKYLIRLFGMEYIKYKREVGVLIPFINIGKEVEKKNLKLYLEEYEDEANIEDIVNFLNDKTEKTKKKWINYYLKVNIIKIILVLKVRKSFKCSKKLIWGIMSFNVCYLIK